MVPKQVSYRFPGIDYCIVSIQRGKVPIPTHIIERRRCKTIKKLKDRKQIMKGKRKTKAITEMGNKEY